ncbi:uncharacterized protein TNCV_3061591 [Trichonephila clavipes]|nr:uncharacterized protein TNCV_3061591 [Trichonephila clavipes]
MFPIKIDIHLSTHRWDARLRQHCSAPGMHLGPVMWKRNELTTQQLAFKCHQKGNMLTKYQMIKFIDFCEVWFLPESVARVAAIVGDHRCHTSRHLLKDILDVFLRYNRPSSFHTLPKVTCCGRWGCNLGQLLFSIGERSGERAGQGSNSI